MSCIFVVVPAVLVLGDWPTFAAAVGAACAALGYTGHRLAGQPSQSVAEQPRIESVELEMANAQVISETLVREQSIQVEKEGVVATFRKDARGSLTLHVEGERSRKELAVIGQQILNRVRQQLAYEKVKGQLLSRGFVLVDEHVDENQSIRLSVRRFQ